MTDLTIDRDALNKVLIDFVNAKVIPGMEILGGCPLRNDYQVDGGLLVFTASFDNRMGDGSPKLLWSIKGTGQDPLWSGSTHLETHGQVACVGESRVHSYPHSPSTAEEIIRFLEKYIPSRKESSVAQEIRRRRTVLEIYLKQVILVNATPVPNSVVTFPLPANLDKGYEIVLDYPSDLSARKGDYPLAFKVIKQVKSLSPDNRLILVRGVIYPNSSKSTEISQWNLDSTELEDFILTITEQLENLGLYPAPDSRWTDVVTRARDGVKRFLQERVIHQLALEDSGYFEFPLNDFMVDVAGNQEGFGFKLKYDKGVLLNGTYSKENGYAFQRVDVEIAAIDLLLTLFTGLMERELKEEPEDPYKNKGITQQAEVALKRLMTDVVIPAIRDKKRGHIVIPVGNFNVNIEGDFESFKFQVFCSGRNLLSGTYDKAAGTGFGINVDVDDLHLLQFVHHLEGLFEQQDKLNQQPVSTPDQTEPPLIKNVDLNDDWVEHYRSLNPGTSYAAVVAQGLCRIKMEIEIAKAVLVKHTLKN